MTSKERRLARREKERQKHELIVALKYEVDTVRIFVSLYGYDAPETRAARKSRNVIYNKITLSAEYKHLHDEADFLMSWRP